MKGRGGPCAAGAVRDDRVRHREADADAGPAHGGAKVYQVREWASRLPLTCPAQGQAACCRSIRKAGRGQTAKETGRRSSDRRPVAYGKRSAPQAGRGSRGQRGRGRDRDGRRLDAQHAAHQGRIHGGRFRGIGSGVVTGQAAFLPVGGHVDEIAHPGAHIGVGERGQRQRAL